MVNNISRLYVEVGDHNLVLAPTSILAVIYSSELEKVSLDFWSGVVVFLIRHHHVTFKPSELERYVGLARVESKQGSHRRSERCHTFLGTVTSSFLNGRTTKRQQTVKIPQALFYFSAYLPFGSSSFESHQRWRGPQLGLNESNNRIIESNLTDAALAQRKGANSKRESFSRHPPVPHGPITIVRHTSSHSFC